MELTYMDVIGNMQRLWSGTCDMFTTFSKVNWMCSIYWQDFFSLKSLSQKNNYELAIKMQ